MRTRKARLIRCGILAYRDPELRKSLHLAPRLVQRAAKAAAENANEQINRELAEIVYVSFKVEKTGGPMTVCQPLTLASTRGEFADLVSRNLNYFTPNLGAGAKQIDISISIPPDYQPKTEQARRHHG